MNITDLIVELLQQGQKVELPEIGTFESVEQSPRHDPDARIYYPATRHIVFRSITTGDDSVVKEIARRECVSEDVARQMWSNYIDALSEKIKRSGEHEPFQREKLLRGIMNSCKKRPVSVADIEQLATNVENALTVTENFEVSYEQIGNLVMQELKKLDAVAYVRFASIYREFKEVGEFVDQIKSMDK